MREQEKAKNEGAGTEEPGPGGEDQIGNGAKNEWKWLVNFIRTK